MPPADPVAPRCLQCGAETAASQGPFCTFCGQPRAPRRLDAREALANAFDTLIGWDSRLLRTVRGLSLRPGRVAREYVEGRRLQYVHPLRYAFWWLALLLILPRIFGIDLTGGMGDEAAFSRGFSESQAETGRELNQLAMRYLDVVSFLALPVFAAVLWLLQGARRFNLAESLALTLFVHGHVYLCGFLITLATLPIPEVGLALRFVFHLAYTTWAVAAFFEIAPWRALGRTVLATVAFIVTTTTLMLAIMLPTMVKTFAVGG